jgi:hypothetical protein
MKKIILSVCIALCTATGAFANAIHFENLTMYPISLFLAGVNPSGTTFASSYININPGPTDFANPTLLPGVPSIATVNARLYALYGFCSPYDVAVGNPALNGPQSQQNFPVGTVCINGAAFSIIWIENPNAPYNITVLIF